MTQGTHSTMQAGQACYEENLTLRTLHASRTAHKLLHSSHQQVWHVIQKLPCRIIAGYA